VKFFRIRKIIIFLIAISSRSHAQPPTVHGFLFCKTNDQESAMSSGCKNDFATMLDFCHKVAKAIGYGYDDRSLMGERFTTQNVKDEIENPNRTYPPINKGDIVIVYFSTHGYKNRNDVDLFPIVDVPNEWISSSEIHNKLLSQHPKFLISIVDACSGYPIQSKQASFLFKAKPFHPSESFASPIYEKEKLMPLFEECSSIIITAAQRGYDAIQTTDGSIFTKSFIDAFNEIISSKKLVCTWNNILTSAKRLTQDQTTQPQYRNYPLPIFASVPVWLALKCQEIISKSPEAVNTSLELLESKFVVQPSKYRFPFFGYRKKRHVEISIVSDKKIDSVVYFLHHSFKDSIVTLKYDTLNIHFNYGLTKVWGEFPIKAIVYYFDGTFEVLQQEVIFDEGDPIYDKKEKRREMSEGVLDEHD
jgi:hypothetical protein